MLFDHTTFLVDDYSPIWSWRGDRHFIQLSADSISLSPVTAENLTLQITACSSWATKQFVDSDERVLLRQRVLSGRAFLGCYPWAVATLTMWLRAARETVPSYGAVLWNVHTGEMVIELPPAYLPAAGRRVVLARQVDALGDMIKGELLPFPLPAEDALRKYRRVGVRGGAISLVCSETRVATYLSDVLTTQDRNGLGGAKQQEFALTVETKVGDSNHSAALRLSVMPPTSNHDSLVFNRQLASSPPRLFSGELLRVLHTMRTMRLWNTHGPAAAGYSEAEQETNRTIAASSADQYLCLEDERACFTPLKPIWRQHVDTTWNGRQANPAAEARRLGCL